MMSANRLMFADHPDALYPTLSQVGDQFSFAIVADPQLTGDRDAFDDWDEHPQLEYRNYYKAIQKINKGNIDFVIILGDFVNNIKKYPSQYRNFVRMTQLFDMPVVLVHGNHDSAGESFGEFYNAQATLSGFQHLYYSFDVGSWHYVVLPAIPDIYKDFNPDTLLDWLANDMLANKDRNTVVLTHYPYLPQGITELEYYVQAPLELRTAIMDEVLKYGNTKYWFSGHVHNGLQTSVKISWEYRGAKFITAPTIITPRAFGEEYPAFERGITQGGYFMTVQMNGATTTIKGHRSGQQQTFT